MTTTTQTIFNLFTGDRPAVNAPFEHDGYVYATDAKKLMRCRKEHVDFDFTPPEHHPKPSHLWAGSNMDTPIDLGKLKLSQYMDSPCRECDGDGEVVWSYKEYTELDECPVCNGIGTEWSPVVVMLGEAAIHVSNAYVLQRVAELTGAAIMVTRIDGPSKPLRFRVGHFDVLIALVFEPSVRDYNFLHIDLP